MKKLFYFLFCLNFYICRLGSVKRNKVLLMCLHNEGENGALSMMEKALRDYGEFDIIRFDRKKSLSSLKEKLLFFFVTPRDMAQANFIFLNDNFMPMANMKFSAATKVIQLWHGEGAMKRSCLAMKLPESEAARLKKCNSRIDALIVSSKSVIGVYEETFGMPKEKIYPLGAPRTDYFFLNDANKLKEKFLQKYPKCVGKKIVLYAPTFRDDEEKNNELMQNFPFEKFAALGEYALLVRLHPQVGGVIEDSPDFYNVTDYPSVSELALIADVLISDYSSIIMDFTVQNKPMVLYAFDLDYFNKDGRGFYFDYESYVPGKVVKTPEELISVFKKQDFETEKIAKFRDFNFDYLDKYNSIRVIEKLVR